FVRTKRALPAIHSSGALLRTSSGGVVTPTMRVDITVCGVSQWRLVIDAVDCYIREQSPDVRPLVERVISGRSRRAGRQPTGDVASTAADGRSRRAARQRFGTDRR